MPASPEWDRVAPDPDPVHDLGYELEEWESYWVTYRDGRQLLMLPEDEDAFGRQAFLVAEEAVVCDLIDSR